MTTHIIGSIYDVKSETFTPPHLFRTKQDFIRTMQSEAQNPQSMLAKFPLDYELNIIGEWSETEGIVNHNEPDRICSIFDLITTK